MDINIDYNLPFDRSPDDANLSLLQDQGTEIKYRGKNTGATCEPLFSILVCMGIPQLNS